MSACQTAVALRAACCRGGVQTSSPTRVGNVCHAGFDGPASSERFAWAHAPHAHTKSTATCVRCCLGVRVQLVGTIMRHVLDGHTTCAQPHVLTQRQPHDTALACPLVMLERTRARRVCKQSTCSRPKHGLDVSWCNRCTTCVPCCGRTSNVNGNGAAAWTVVSLARSFLVSASMSLSSA